VRRASRDKFQPDFQSGVQPAFHPVRPGFRCVNDLKGPTVPTYAPPDAARPIDSPPGQPLGDLLRRAGQHDSAAWDELVSRHEPLVLRTARAAGLQPSDAADAAQLTWLRLLEHIGQIRQPDRLPGWLAVTARREAARIAAAARRCHLYDGPGDGHPASRALAVTDRYPAEGCYSPPLAAALDKLPPAYRRLLHALMSDECPRYAEVARKMGIPVGSIGPMRMRALHMLRQILAGTPGPLPQAA
jgi:DNA-directed RNA polymerase specialized sigma24 family protein